MKPGNAIELARKLKHQGLMFRRAANRAAMNLKNSALASYDSSFRYTFNPEKHKTKWGEHPRMYFLHRDPPEGCSTVHEVPGRIFVLWTGENKLSVNRSEGLESIVLNNPDRDVTLVTPTNLSEFIVPGHPLHSAYENLSLVHRSDYLRAYLMHYHGGGYSDIKRTNKNWDSAFKQASAEPGIWLTGYRELGSDRVGGRDPRLGREIRMRYRSLVGFGAFICRPRTPLTGEWLREIERRLDYYREELSQFPGNTFGNNRGYPIQWIELGMDILYPLELKYSEHLSYSESILPDLENHR